MPYIYYNPNPYDRKVDDCTVRAISKLFNMPWYWAYDELYAQGRVIGNMPSANEVWGEFLRKHGFSRYTLPNSCPHCTTIAEFCEQYPRGRYALATGSHVVAAIDGYYYDIRDSGDEVVAYFWER